MSKRSTRCVEFFCVLSTLMISLVLASVRVEQAIRLHSNNIGSIICHRAGIQVPSNHSDAVLMSIYFGVNVEVVLVSISLCVIFCLIRRRIRNNQTARLLRNFVYYLGINAFMMVVYSIGAAYNIYLLLTRQFKELRDSTTHNLGIFLWNVLFMLAVGASTIVHALLGIPAAPKFKKSSKFYCKKCCYANQDHPYAVIDETDARTTTPASTRISQPSYTATFTVPYTGGFTSITASDSSGDSE